MVTCGRLRPDPERLDDPVQGVKMALRSIASRADELACEAKQLKRQLDALTKQAPRRKAEMRKEPIGWSPTWDR